MPLVPLWESHEMYKKSLQAFIDNSTIRQSAILSLQQDSAREALKKIIETVDPNEPLKVLGIGSGSGDIDLLILQTLAEYFASQKNKKPAFQASSLNRAPLSSINSRRRCPPCRHCYSRLRPAFRLNGIRKRSMNSTRQPLIGTVLISFTLFTASIT